MCLSELLLGLCVYMCPSELLLELPHAQGLCVYIQYASLKNAHFRSVERPCCGVPFFEKRKTNVTKPDGLLHHTVQFLSYPFRTVFTAFRSIPLYLVPLARRPAAILKTTGVCALLVMSSRAALRAWHEQNSKLQYWTIEFVTKQYFILSLYVLLEGKRYVLVCWD